MGGHPDLLYYDGGGEFMGDEFHNHILRKNIIPKVGGWYNPDHQ